MKAGNLAGYGWTLAAHTPWHRPALTPYTQRPKMEPWVWANVYCAAIGYFY